jgi:hypothetical protein
MITEEKKKELIDEYRDILNEGHLYIKNDLSHVHIISKRVVEKGYDEKEILKDFQIRLV